LEPDKLYDFIPTVEKDEPEPVTFYVIPMTYGQFTATITTMRALGAGGFSINTEDVLKANIKKIENVVWPGSDKPVTIDGPGQIRRFVDSCSTVESVGVMQEVFKFIQSLSIPTEDEAGN